MRLDPHFEIIPKAISVLAKRFAEEGLGYLEKAKVVALLRFIRPSGGSLDTSLLTQLESEGVLSIEPVRGDDGSLAEMVRFTFERFSDHAIAEKLLADHLNKNDVLGSFRAGSSSARIRLRRRQPQARRRDRSNRNSVTRKGQC